MGVAIGVLTEAPIPGRCKEHLLGAHGAEWVAGLCAAMLRDTLDGLLSIEADRYVVFATADGDAFEVLRRHAPSPWEIVSARGKDHGAQSGHALEELFARGGDVRAVLARADAPSFPTEPLASAIEQMVREPSAIVGPADGGGTYLVATNQLEPRLVRDVPWGTPAVLVRTRAICKELELVLEELPEWYAVDAPSDVLRLLDELRRHPERAPRTAQFLLTRS